MPEDAHEREGRERHEGENPEQGQIVLGPVDADPTSPAQKIPKLVSSTPTTNLIVFSGTRLSGARIRTPTVATITNAASAAPAASGTSCWLLPNVTTMNATSSPPSRTPLNATVNAYQSRPARGLTRCRARLVPLPLDGPASSCIAL